MSRRSPEVSACARLRVTCSSRLAFKRLVTRRWTISLVLLAALFATYYGYILLIAYDKPFMAQRIGRVTTLGIPLGVAVILVSWVLTAVYVAWANAPRTTRKSAGFS